MIDTVYGNGRDITYSGDKFVKVEAWKCAIEKAERRTFERTRNSELGMRPYFFAMNLATIKNY